MQQAKIIVGVMLFAIPAPAMAQTLWDKLSIGMTFEEAKGTDPDLVYSLEEQREKDGSTCKLKKKSDIVLAGHQYRLCVRFKADQLSGIDLSSTSNPKVTSDDFERIIAVLTGKFGKPKTIREITFGRETIWSAKDNMAISAVFLDKVPFMGPLISVTIKPK